MDNKALQIIEPSEREKKLTELAYLALELIRSEEYFANFLDLPMKKQKLIEYKSYKENLKEKMKLYFEELDINDSPK